jgi:hypothetical protein
MFILLLLYCLCLLKTSTTAISYIEKRNLKLFNSYLPYISSSSSSSFDNYSLSSKEINALFDLYNNTNGSNWIWQNESLSGLKWNFTNGISPCSFQGISCICSNISSTNNSEYHPYKSDIEVDTPYGLLYYNYYDDISYLSKDIIYNNSSRCNINKIYLINFNLNGYLDNSIGNFSYLSHLHLTNNKLIGTLPSTLNQLKSLKILSIGDNLLTGSLPELSELYNLTCLNVQINKLNGNLGSWIGNLINLKSLFLSWNSFSGNIPKQIGNLKELRLLGLGYCTFSGFIPRQFYLFIIFLILFIFNSILFIFII